MGLIKIDKTYEGNISQRLAIIKQLQSSPQIYYAIRNELASDPIAFFNLVLMTFDPRSKKKDLPFITYAFQDTVILKIVDAYENKHDLLIEKSRDMGVSYITLGVIFWLWLFRRGFTCLCGSRKEMYVDNYGDMSSLFEKLRYFLRCLPSPLKPLGFDSNRHQNYMRMKNPEMHSEIIGESSSPQFSRGGRYSLILLDEFAFFEDDKSVLQATADASPCRLFVSTPNGMGNAFAQLRHNSDTEVCNVHWKLHPAKSDEWYQAECRRRNDDVSVAQELDISYLKSGRQFFDADTLIKCKDSVIKPIRKIRLEREDRKVIPMDDSGFGLWIYTNPTLGRRYVIGADVSQGIGQDKSTAVVRDHLTREVMAVYQGDIDPDNFADFLFDLGEYYNYALLAVESNNHGFTVNSALVRMRYRNLYQMLVIDERTQARSRKMGYHTTRKTKRNMFNSLKSELRDGDAYLRDSRAYLEAEVFVVEDNGDMNASTGYCDDILCAYAISSVICDTQPAMTRPTEVIIPFNKAQAM